MKTILILLSFLMLCSAYAGNAVLLSSLKLNKLNYLYLDYKFKKAFAKTDLKVVINHKVSPQLLHQTLNDPETEILIWISHASGEHPSENGLGAKGVILDLFGNDVKNFFTTTTGNLKFLGLVGCEAKSILEGFKARGNFDHRPDLEIKSFNEKVKLYAGFKETLKESLNHINKPTTQNFDQEGQIDLNIKLAGPTPSWIEMGDQVLAMLDQDSPQEIDLLLPEHLLRKMKNKNIKLINAKSNQKDETPLGQLEFTSILGTWKIFATKTGTIIGGDNQHLFIFKKYDSET